MHLKFSRPSYRRVILISVTKVCTDLEVTIYATEVTNSVRTDIPVVNPYSVGNGQTRVGHMYHLYLSVCVMCCRVLSMLTVFMQHGFLKKYGQNEDGHFSNVGKKTFRILSARIWDIRLFLRKVSNINAWWSVNKVRRMACRWLLP